MLFIVWRRDGELTLPNVVICFSLCILLLFNLLNNLYVVGVEVIEENVSTLLIKFYNCLIPLLLCDRGPMIELLRRGRLHKLL